MSSAAIIRIIYQDHGIENDPNRMLEENGHDRYIVELISRVVRVSVETQRIVGGLMRIMEIKQCQML